MVAGHTVDAEPVQPETDAQYRTLTALRTVTVDEYRAMGRSCVGNDAWHAAYEAIAPGRAAYQRDAIETYATTRLHCVTATGDVRSRGRLRRPPQGAARCREPRLRSRKAASRRAEPSLSDVVNEVASALSALPPGFRRVVQQTTARTRRPTLTPGRRRRAGAEGRAGSAPAPGGCRPGPPCAHCSSPRRTGRSCLALRAAMRGRNPLFAVRAAVLDAALWLPLRLLLPSWAGPERSARRHTCEGR